MHSLHLLLTFLLLLLTNRALGASEELLNNPGFEGSYSGVAPGWTRNTWPSSGDVPSFNFSRSIEIVHSGNSSQRIAVSSLPPGAGVALWQNQADKAGAIYEYRLWIRSESGSVKVQVLFRQPMIFYREGATVVLNATTTWQEVVIRGGYERKNGTQVGLMIQQAGTIYIDDASFKEVTLEVLNEQTLNPTRPVPSDLFGLHILKLGTHNVWPDTDFGVLRLWNTGTAWPSLELNKGNWSLSRLNYYLRHTNKHCPSCKILLTLGLTPIWAASNPSQISSGYSYASTSPPRNNTDWRDYVRHIAQHVKQYNVTHFEIWNEVNIASFHWSGSAAQMLELARIAYEEIKAVDPNYVVLSPDTTSTGLGWMSQFLYLGGAQYFDALSMHLYPLTSVELSLPTVHGMHTLRKHYGIMDKPIWLTEGSPGGVYGIPGEESTEDDDLPDPVVKAAVGRMWTLLWSYGIDSYHWYFWELGNSTQVELSSFVDKWNRTTLGGDCYREMVAWLKGAQLESKSFDEDGWWQITFVRPTGRKATIMWMMNSTRHWNVPENWANVQLFRLTEEVRGLEANEEVRIDIVPVMVEYDYDDTSDSEPDSASTSYANSALLLLGNVWALLSSLAV